jgi:2-methylcitrate dehydratase PrpD
VLALFHFSPPVYSAALAIGEAAEASGRDLVTALAAGCEMMERASRAANPSLRNRGYHTTPTAGVFGATIAAGKLLRLSPQRLTSALGLAGAQSAGLMEMYGPSMQKRFNPGPAARGGVTSALMAKLGFTGTALIFEGERGWLKAYTDANQPGALVEGMGEPYQLDIEFKPYSCARPIHNAIDCALAIRAQPGFDPARITAIDIERHEDWSKYHRNAQPATYHEAQVSLPFSMAVAMREGKALLEQYSPRNIRNAEVRRLAGLARFDTVDDLPRGVSVRMTATEADGTEFKAQVDYPKGSIENPMSDDELRAKFDSLAVPVLGPARAAALADAAMNVEKLASVGDLMKLTSVRGRAGRKRA